MDDTPANHHNDDLTALLAEVAHQTSNGVVITDTQRRVRWVNGALNS